MSMQMSLITNFGPRTILRGTQASEGGFRSGSSSHRSFSYSHLRNNLARLFGGEVREDTPLPLAAPALFREPSPFGRRPDSAARGGFSIPFSGRALSTGCKGLTLIELLTVIATLGVLASLLVPIVHKAREHAKLARTTSNLRQLGMAALTYSADNGDRFPPHAIFDPQLGQNREWCFAYVQGDAEAAVRGGILGPYLGQAAAVLRDPTFDPQEPELAAFVPWTKPARVAFGYNGFNLSRRVNAWGHWEGYPVSSVRTPSATVLFATSGELQGDTVASFETVWSKQYLPNNPTIRAVDGTHALVCWASGHVSRHPLDRTARLTKTTPVLGHITGPAGENLFDR